MTRDRQAVNSSPALPVCPLEHLEGLSEHEADQLVETQTVDQPGNRITLTLIRLKGSFLSASGLNSQILETLVKSQRIIKSPNYQTVVCLA